MNSDKRLLAMVFEREMKTDSSPYDMHGLQLEIRANEIFLDSECLYNFIYKILQIGFLIP